MNILSADTSTDVLSIALSTDNSYEERLVKGRFSHSEDLLAEIESLLSRAGIGMTDLDLLAVTKGPGSFTGLRIGMASMKGISSALSVPLASIPTLDAIAEAASTYPGAILPAIDARKHRFYISLHKGGRTIVPDRDGNAEDIIPYIRDEELPVLVTGPDAAAFSERIAEADPGIRTIVDPEAPRNISRALQRLAAARLASHGPDDIGEGPVYIRRSDAEEALEKRMKERKEDGV